MNSTPRSVHVDRYLPYPNPEVIKPSNKRRLKRRRSPFNAGGIILFIFILFVGTIGIGILGCWLLTDNFNFVTLMKDLYATTRIPDALNAIGNFFASIFSTIAGWFGK
ncbi:MAG: hypothetical protein LBS99_01375 [Clostridiales bacterium]|jgi:hypothetical protein|nr:hypothetical protein [Clostridiales bacterium]